jgi:hypothetical protein
MKNTKLSYTYLIIIHAIIALAVFSLPFLSKILALILPIAGFYVVNKTKNKNNEVLIVAAYMIGVEVFLRMTDGNFNNEYIKFNVIFFMLMGMVYSNFSTNAFVYWFFLILLIPGILITSMVTDYDVDFRTRLPGHFIYIYLSEENPVLESPKHCSCNGTAYYNNYGLFISL